MYKKIIFNNNNNTKKLLKYNKIDYKSLSTYLFDHDTAVKKIGISNIDNNIMKFRSKITDNYSIGDAPNGGYLMCIAINAAREYIGPIHRDPFTITAHFLNKSLENIEADIYVQILNKAKSTTTVEISIVQEDIIRSKFIGTFGDFKKMKGLTNKFLHEEAPLISPIHSNNIIDGSKFVRKTIGDKLKISNTFDMLIDSQDPFSRSVLKGKTLEKEASINAWIKFSDGRMPCLRSLAFFSDALPPPILCLAPSNWVPTIELTVHFHNRPQIEIDSNSNSNESQHIKDEFYDKARNEGYLRANFKATYCNNGLVTEDGKIWDASGKILLASSRQYARLLSPKI
jgi:hypothetical protein